MCRHNKGTYKNYETAAKVVDDWARRARRNGRSQVGALRPYQCKRCHRWMVFRPRFRDRIRPYYRPRARREVQQVVLRALGG